MLIVDLQNINRVLLIDLKLVHADDDILATIDAGLLLGSSFFNAQLGHPALDRFGHAAQLIDLGNQLPRFGCHIVCEALHHVGPPPRIDHLPDPGLLLKHKLGVAGYPCRKIRRQSDRFIECVGVQRLGATKHCRHRLDSGANDVVIGILLR